MEWNEKGQYKGIAYYHISHISPCILWLHGYTMDSSIWQDMINKFPYYSHLVIDLPGHGASVPIETFPSLPVLTKAVIELSSEFEVKYIVGISFGGLIAIQMAIDAPDNYDALILNSSPVGGGPVDTYAETKNIELIKLYKLGVKNEVLCDTWMQGPPEIFTGAKKKAELWNFLKAIILKHKWAELRNNTYSMFVGHNQLTNGLAGIKIPVHLLVGEDDMENIKRCAEIIRRTVRHATRIYIPNCGHLAILEAPDTCTEILKMHFLTDPSTYISN